MLKPEEARIRSFTVVPKLPDPLQPLMDIARNLWWTWHSEAVDLFVRMDRQLWKATRHNPVKMLGSCPQDKLEALARDESYLAAMRRAHERLDYHLNRSSWFQQKCGDQADCRVAYFSAEFGLTECLQVYSGGLGVLAGDHLKSASELGVPLVAVGLMYRNGYFQQYLNADGWQQEYYPDLDFANLPMQRITDDSGRPVIVHVDLPGRSLHIGIWRVDVGRVELYLLDANQPENTDEDRLITAQLYGGDMEMRIKQEIVLGIGGVRTLDALGIKPTVYHMNEGHAAFLALERIRQLIQKHDVSFDEARWAASAANVFTTHTPVPAGIDRFPADMVQRYFADFQGQLKLDTEGLLALGRENVFNKNEFFSMAVLALRTSDAANGVSKLHGDVARQMWRSIWPGVPAQEVPIGHVTNGVHARSWVSSELIDLMDRHSSRRWHTDADDHSAWGAIDEVPDEELWRTHELQRYRLVTWVRRKLRQQLERSGAATAELEEAAEALDANVLTIGFARRFATYKRANLLFRDPERILKILNKVDQPLQLVVAGKAHPADTQGKELIRQIIHFAREHRGSASRRIVFVENYDINVARYLVQGVDVWLNTPRRGMEASGTSGMKAAMNGAMNLSILDGWWDEGWQKDIGWAIGNRETYSNYDYQDQIESEAVYNLLEKHIVPMFYERDAAGLPRRWIAGMRQTIRSLAPFFNTNRMVQDYTSQYYVRSHQRSSDLMANNLAGAVDLTRYRLHLRSNWGQIKIESIDAETTQPLYVRAAMPISGIVQLGALEPHDVKVQVYYGALDADGAITDGAAVDMEHAEALGEGRHRFHGHITAGNSGSYGFALRVIPGNDALATPFLPGMIAWDDHVGPAAATPTLAIGAAAS